jgi:phage repressor protein C with HTH and peptisase S24 domain
MPGGFRDGSGRGFKYGEGEPSVKVGVPFSMRFSLPVVLEKVFVDQKVSGDEIIRRIEFGGSTVIKKYDHAVSAGPGHTSSLGGDSFNNSYEEIDLVSMLVRKPDRTTMITAHGESMMGIGICHGDLLIVEECERPNIGDIVVVYVNDELMVKRYRVENDEVILFSENPDYPPIRTSGKQVKITGIVKHSIRMNFSKSG